MEGGNHWDSSKIYCKMEKRLIAVRKQNGGAIQHIFSLIAVSGYRSHAVRRVEIIGHFLLFGTQYSFAYFIVKTKAYNVIISIIVQLWLLFKQVIFFCLNSIAEQYNIIAKLGTFFYDPPSVCHHFFLCVVFLHAI